MKLGIIRLTMIAVLVASVPATFGAAADRKEGQATILEENAFTCSNCFFGSTDYYYCLSVDSKTLIVRDRLPVFNWRDPKRNYLGRYVKLYKEPQTAGPSVKVEYDDHDVWVPMSDGTTRKLKQDYTRDIFIDHQQCREVVHIPQPSDKFSARLFHSYGVK